MADKPSLVHVEIFGQTYAVRPGTDPGYVEKLAAYVDEQMKDVSRASGAVDSLRVAVLAALNLADECLRLRHDVEEARRESRAAGTTVDERDRPPREEARLGPRRVAACPAGRAATIMLSRLSALPVMDTATSNQRLS